VKKTTLDKAWAALRKGIRQSAKDDANYSKAFSKMKSRIEKT